jgi:16S rRNA (cytidine1402-2'-O)-methyltransferase
VATPIGNLEDITLRALRILREVPLIAAEDTRTAQRLLAHYAISTPTTSFFEHNEQSKQDSILRALHEGDVALISEAGMPGISDPGYRLVSAALEAGFQVVPIPGPSALTTALAIAGLPTDSFVYLGFLPRRAAARRKALAEWAEHRQTLVIFEAPHRLVESLQDVRQALGNRPAVVCRELTKQFEEARRGDLESLIQHYVAEPPRGEITLIIGGRSEEQRAWDEPQVEKALSELIADGQTRTAAAKAVAARAKWPRQQVYQLAIRLAADADHPRA